MNRESGVREGEPTRTARGDRSRQEILAAAGALAARGSYAGTTISAISKACGLPPTSIYWHFESKAGLFSALLRQGLHDWLRQLAASLEVSGSEKMSLGAWLNATARSLKAQPQALRLLIQLSLELSQEDAMASVSAREARRGAVAMTMAMLRQSEATCAVETSAMRELADAMVSYIHGAFLADQLDPIHNDLEAALDRLAIIAPLWAEAIRSRTSAVQSPPPTLASATPPSTAMVSPTT